MRPYNVEIFTQDFEMVANSNVNEVTYKEDYLSSDENSVTVFAMPGIRKQDYIRISRGPEEYAGVITEIAYGTDRSKELQVISYKPLMELLNTDVLFDVDLQQTGTLEDFIADRIREMFIENEDAAQNIKGLSVQAQTQTTGWYFHITPKDSGGHYNIVNLIDSVIIRNGKIRGAGKAGSGHTEPADQAKYREDHGRNACHRGRPSECHTKEDHDQERFRRCE